MVSIVKRYGKLDEVTALKMLLLTTKALNSIYEQKRVTHNDLSPVNIFIDKYFRAKLIDPCSSTINGERLPNTVCMYTRAICAPELHHEKPTGTIFHDVFALGPTLYFLVTETFMFPNKSGSKSYEQKMSQSEENLPGVSEDLSRLIRRLTNPNPFLRYDNYPELINDIKELILSKLYPE